MMKRLLRGGAGLSLFAALLIFASGCGDTGKKDTAKDATKKVESDKHAGWWCDEHGVPEEVCSQCSKKYAAECKKKGDWCADHNRAKSHCFLCDPSLKEKFAAQYRAKYGKEPPPTEDESKTTK